MLTSAPTHTHTHISLAVVCLGKAKERASERIAHNCGALTLQRPAGRFVSCIKYDRLFIIYFPVYFLHAFFTVVCLLSEALFNLCSFPRLFTPM